MEFQPRLLKVFLGTKSGGHPVAVEVRRLVFPISLLPGAYHLLRHQTDPLAHPPPILTFPRDESQDKVAAVLFPSASSGPIRGRINLSSHNFVSPSRIIWTTRSGLSAINKLRRNFGSRNNRL